MVPNLDSPDAEIESPSRKRLRSDEGLPALQGSSKNGKGPKRFMP